MLAQQRPAQFDPRNASVQMLGSLSLCEDADRLSKQRLGLGVLVVLHVHARQIGDADAGKRVFATVHRSIDGEHALGERLRFVEPAARQRHASQVVERRGNLGMHLPENALPYGERLLKQAPRLVVAVRLETESPAQHGQTGGGLIVIRSVERLRDVERLAVVSLGFLVMSPLLLHGAEIYCVLGYERVTLTGEPAGYRENKPVERISDRQVSGVVVRVCQLAQAGRQLRCCLASGRPAESNRLLERLYRLSVPAPILQG